MRTLLRFVALIAQMGLVACATNIEDVRLERVVPASSVAIPAREFDPAPQVAGGVVAEFSSARDIRRQVVRFRPFWLSADIRPCEAQLRVETGSSPRPTVGTGFLLDEFGYLDHAADRASSAGMPRDGPSAGVPRDGRFRFMVQIHLVSLDRPTPATGSQSSRLVSWYDLRRDQNDLCFFVDAPRMIETSWRTNTVVIPYALIRAALEAAPASPAR